MKGSREKQRYSNAAKEIHENTLGHAQLILEYVPPEISVFCLMIYII